jgi:hypothetical protein
MKQKEMLLSVIMTWLGASATGMAADAALLQVIQLPLVGDRFYGLLPAWSQA